MRTRRARAVILSLLMAALLPLAACQPAAVQAPAPTLLEPVGVQLDTASVRRGILERRSVYPATVRPTTHTLAFAVAGTVEQIDHVVGDRVTAGDEIARLDDSQLATRLTELAQQRSERRAQYDFDRAAAQIRYDETEAQLAEWRRAGGSVQVGEQWLARADAVAIGELDLEAAAAELADLERLYRFDDERLAELERQFETESEARRLLTQVSGRIIFLANTDRGDVAAYAPFAIIADEEAPVVETAYISQSTLEGAIEVELQQGEARFALTPEPTDWADLISRSLSGREMISRYAVDEDARAALDFGRYAQVSVVTERREDCLLLPLASLFRESGQTFVYIVEDGRRVRRDVEIGMQNEVEVEVLSGLEEGEPVYVKS